MARKLQIKRGQKANMPTLAEGELGFTTDEKKVYIGTGSENIPVSVVTKADVGLENVDNTSDVNKPVSTAVQTALNTKVDKVSGKGLSSNDFTAAYKAKLENAPEDITSAVAISNERVKRYGLELPGTLDKALERNVQILAATVPVSGWTTAPTSAGWYENQVNVAGMKAVYNPLLDLVITNAALAEDERAAFGLIMEAETFDGHVVFRVLDVPDISLNVRFVGV